MKRHEEIQPEERSLQDKAYDLLGEMILERETELLTCALAAQKARGDTAEMDAFFARQQKRDMARIHEYFRKKQIHHFFTHSLPKASQATAIVIAVLALAGGAAVASSATFRVQVMKLLATTEQQYTSLQLVVDESASFDVPAEWQGRCYPSYIPEGMELETVWSEAEQMSFVLYKDAAKGDKRVEFNELNAESESNIDTEDAVVTPITIGGWQGYISQEDNICMAYWSDGQSYFIVKTMNFDNQAALDIARSVRSVR